MKNAGVKVLVVLLSVVILFSGFLVYHKYTKEESVTECKTQTTTIAADKIVQEVSVIIDDTNQVPIYTEVKDALLDYYNYVLDEKLPVSLITESEQYRSDGVNEVYQTTTLVEKYDFVYSEIVSYSFINGKYYYAVLKEDPNVETKPAPTTANEVKDIIAVGKNNLSAILNSIFKEDNNSQYVSMGKPITEPFGYFYDIKSDVDNMYRLSVNSNNLRFQVMEYYTDDSGNKLYKDLWADNTAEITLSVENEELK